MTVHAFCIALHSGLDYEVNIIRYHYTSHEGVIRFCRRGSRNMKPAPPRLALPGPHAGPASLQIFLQSQLDALELNEYTGLFTQARCARLCPEVREATAFQEWAVVPRGRGAAQPSSSLPIGATFSLESNW